MSLLTNNLITVRVVAPFAQWFVSGNAGDWLTLPGVNTVMNAIQAAPAQPALNGATPNPLEAYNGACVDQNRGEYLLIANGGHDDYRGNECLAISIRSANPKWYRLNDHSPNSMIDAVMAQGSVSTSNLVGNQGANPSGFTAMFLDGRMRACHNWYNYWFHNGKAWIVMQGSPSGVGFSTGHAWSFDRNYPGLAAAFGQTPLAWSQDAGPWKWLGRTMDGNKASNAVDTTGMAPGAVVWTALDPVTGLIWYTHTGQSALFEGFGSLNTGTEALQHVVFSPTVQPACAAIAVDPNWDGVVGDPNNTCRWRFMVTVPRATVAQAGPNQILVHDLKAANPYATSALTLKTVPQPLDRVRTIGMGMVYHRASRSFLFTDPVTTLDGIVGKLRVPTNADGTYNASGAWNLTMVPPGPSSASIWTGTSPGSANGGYTFGKARLMENIANNQDGIVLCNGSSLPTYVYKLPPGELMPASMNMSVQASGRYFTVNGSPQLLAIDTAWSGPAQLNPTQLAQYLDTRQAQGFNGILFQAPVWRFTNQVPNYNTYDGIAPFNPTAYNAINFASPTAAYWQKVDLWVNECLKRGLFCFIFPAYTGFGTNVGTVADEGIGFALAAALDADLTSYGTFLGNRYKQGNIIWCAGGDSVANTTKQWNIFAALRAVQPSALITAHGVRDTDALTNWSTFPINVNAVYANTTTAYSDMLSAYARSPALPAFLIEDRYELHTGITTADLRRQAYQSMLSGACGCFFGNVQIWGFGQPYTSGSSVGDGLGPQHALDTYLGSTGAVEFGYWRTLFQSYQWWKLAPATDTSVVTTALGSGTTRICPARASDGSFAMVWNPSATALTVNLGAIVFTPSQSQVRARYYNPTTGAFTSAGTFANTGTQAFTFPFEAVLVLDAV